MKPAPTVRGLLIALVVFTTVTPPLAAQNVLYAEHGGKFRPVVRAEGLRPYVQFEGKVVAANGRRFALDKVEEYLPVFVAVRNIEVKTMYVDVGGSSINHDFLFHASLESPYRLDDVFIVLELDTESAGKVLFVQEVGEIKARQPNWISILVPLASGLGSGQYLFHLFAKGAEVLQSEIPPMYRDEVVDRMIAKRLPTVPDAAPTLFIGPEPEYPAAFRKAKTKGQAVVNLRIGANGRVYDPAVRSATDPAFGQAALNAVRLWRFLPRMKAGRPVETQADIPINFTPPSNPAEKS